MIQSTHARPPVRPFEISDVSTDRSEALGAGWIEAIVAGRIERRRRERRERRILASFAEMHPDWHASLFDAAFLANDDARRAIETRDAAKLAAAWTRQFRYADETSRRHDVRVVTPVAGDFLSIVEDERNR